MWPKNENENETVSNNVLMLKIKCYEQFHVYWFDFEVQYLSIYI